VLGLELRDLQENKFVELQPDSHRSRWIGQTQSKLVSALLNRSSPTLPLRTTGWENSSKTRPLAWLFDQVHAQRRRPRRAGDSPHRTGGHDLCPEYRWHRARRTSRMAPTCFCRRSWPSTGS